MTEVLGRGQTLAGRRGFTLLELVVAVVVMGLLSAVAITTGNKVIAKSHDASAAATVTAFAKEASALARLQEAFSIETLLAAGDDLHLNAAAGTWADSTSVAVGGPTSLAEAVWGTVYVQTTPDGQVAGIAATSRSGNCVRAHVGYPWDTEVFVSTKPLGVNCSAGEALKGAPGVDAAGNPTGAADFFDDGTPFAVGHVTPNPKVHRIDVTWEVSAQAERYILSRANSADGPFAELTTTTTTEYQDKAVSIYEEYYYQVVAVNKADTSPAVVGGPATPLPIVQELGTTNTDSAQVFTVPAGVTRMTIHAYGAQGGVGDTASSPNGWEGGSYGGLTEAVVDVTPGQVLHVAVGRRGTDSNPSSGDDDGWSLRSPGGPGGTATTAKNKLIRAGGGGGATEVFAGGTTKPVWVMTAGGGGGCGYDPTNPSVRCSAQTHGGTGGGTATDGKSRSTAKGGKGGTTSGPGTAGGSLADGTLGYPGGGGGGGCKGGTGGEPLASTSGNGSGAGGGGGSGCAADGPGVLSSSTSTSTHQGNGKVVIRY